MELDPCQEHGPTGGEQPSDEQHQEGENGVQNKHEASCSTVKLPDLNTQTKVSSIIENLRSKLLVQSHDKIPCLKGQKLITSFVKP